MTSTHLDKMKQINQLIWSLNLDFGWKLNDGLEERGDQLISLYEKQIKEDSS